MRYFEHPTGDTIQESLGVNSTSYVLSNLTAGAIYGVSVIAVSNETESKPAFSYRRTSELYIPFFQSFHLPTAAQMPEKTSRDLIEFMTKSYDIMPVVLQENIQLWDGCICIFPSA